MFRALMLLSLGGLLLGSCSSDSPRTCPGEEPQFKVVLRLSARPLPRDTVVHVSYAGSGKEDFRLAAPDSRLEVTFCRIANEDGTPREASASTADGLDGAGAAGAAGAGGAAGAAGKTSVVDEPDAPALYCELFTAGFTELEVSGTGFATVDYDLTPNREQCTLEKDLVLDAPDAG